MVYYMIKCLFHFYAIETYFNGTNFDTEFLLRFNLEQNLNELNLEFLGVYAI